MFKINPVNRSFINKIQNKIDQKTKPKGALGMLESIAVKLAQILQTNQQQSININQPVMLVFAGDHGIAEENISIAPSEITQQMVFNFLNGGAAINCFCRCNDLMIEVIDAGILLPIDDKRLTQQSLGNGTKNFVNQAAMSLQHVNQGLLFGKVVVERRIKNGSNVFGFGEMGIGNTSSAAAIQSILMKLPVEKCVGRGTGINDVVLEKKTRLLQQAIKFHKQRLGQKLDEPLELMAALGGFEVVQMVGAMLAVAENQGIILVDGFIATAAAMLAHKLYPNCKEYMIFCHQSDEQGHQLMLKHLSVVPLLNLGLRLGEGTGAALAMPLIRSAACFYNDMASFESAGVTAV